jgi:hypothetical protein
MMTQKLYSIDVQIWATAYIRADSEEQALEMAKAMEGDSLFVEDDGPGLFTGRDFADLFHDDDIVDLTFSPCMTVGKLDSEEIVDVAYDPDEEPTETQQGLIPIPDGYAEG